MQRMYTVRLLRPAGSLSAGKDRCPGGNCDWGKGDKPHTRETTQAPTHLWGKSDGKECAVSSSDASRAEGSGGRRAQK